MSKKQRNIIILSAILIITLIICVGIIKSKNQLSTFESVKIKDVVMDNIDRNYEIESPITDEIILDYIQYDDVRDLDLRNMTYNIEDIKTYWFNEKTNFGRNESYAVNIIEKGKNPGLGVRLVHENGITGFGVKVGIIDENMFLNHPEFDGKIVGYKDFYIDRQQVRASMHGSSVTSILVGETIGVAPNAEVYYAVVPSNLGDSKYYADALLWLIEINKTLPVDDKIRVVSVSAAPSGEGSLFDKNNDKWDEAVQLAKEEDILVLDCTTTYGFILPGYYDIEDPDDFSLFKIGSPNYDMEEMLFQDYIFAPGIRTLAEEYIDKEPSFHYSGQSGHSWSIPYIAGTLALGWEVDSTLTGNEIIEILFDTAYKLEDGNKVVNPIKFIEYINDKK